MSQCSILFVGPCCRLDAQKAALRSLGFLVADVEDLPPAPALSSHHVVIVLAPHPQTLPVVAARVRAQAHFGRRVLLALVPSDTPDRDKRDAVVSGFDETVPDNCDGRQLAATILRRLRPYPEYRCMLRSPHGRRKAA